MRVKIFLSAALLSAALPAAAASFACPDYGPLPAQPTDYASAIDAFGRYRDSKKSAIRAEGDLPFLKTHGAPTDDAVLLIHGLSDSPYYVAALGAELHARGANVVSILLPGHGTAPECLLHVRASQWREETRFGLSLARRLGRRVSILGFSTGGALALDALAESEMTREPEPQRWGDLLLFSPALAFDTPKTDWCGVPGADAIMEHAMPWASGKGAPETNPYKYAQLATNGVCQLFDLMEFNELRRPLIERALSARRIGVFAVESLDDQTVDPQAVVGFVADLPASVRRELILYPRSDAIAHADVPRPETNPRYAETVAAMDRFLSGASAPVAADALLEGAAASAAGLRR